MSDAPEPQPELKGSASVRACPNLGHPNKLGLELLEALGFTIELHPGELAPTIDGPGRLTRGDVVELLSKAGLWNGLYAALISREKQRRRICLGGPLHGQPQPWGWSWNDRFFAWRPEADEGRTRGRWACYARADRFGEEPAPFVGWATSEAKARRGQVSEPAPPLESGIRLLPVTADEQQVETAPPKKGA